MSTESSTFRITLMQYVWPAAVLSDYGDVFTKATIIKRLKSLRPSPTPNSAGKDVKSLIMKDTLTWYESFKLKSFTEVLITRNDSTMYRDKTLIQLLVNS